jgi:hypothetical protein
VNADSQKTAQSTIDLIAVEDSAVYLDLAVDTFMAGFDDFVAVAQKYLEDD